MATPVRTDLNASDVSTGGPTRTGEYNSVRDDIDIAITERDHGTNSQIPPSPTVSQMFLDTTNNELLFSFDGSSFQAISASGVTVDSSGISLTGGAGLTTDSNASSWLLGDVFMTSGAVAPVGTDAWVTV